MILVLIHGMNGLLGEERVTYQTGEGFGCLCGVRVDGYVCMLENSKEDVPLRPRMVSRFRRAYMVVSVLSMICHGVNRSVVGKELDS